MTRSLPPCPEPARSLPPSLRSVLGRSPAAMTLGLSNIRRLLGQLGNPQDALRTAVVAGTNGKGSVTAMLASVLQAAGLRVGRFTSPHVYAVNERIAIDGRPVPLAELEAAAARVAALGREVSFSYFEGLMAIASLVFVERGVDVAVFETGLGGRFDATNVTRPCVTVITSIALDHRRLLGDTKAEILLEKYGIARAGVPLLAGELEPELEDALRVRARRDGVPVAVARELGRVRVADEGPFDLRVQLHTGCRNYGVIQVPFPGRHQAMNALLAVAAAERVLAPALPPAAAVEHAYLPARFEPFDLDGRCFVLDVAHNDAALCAAADGLARVSPREQASVVLGLMRRKELFDAPAALLRTARRVVSVAATGSRSSAGDAYSAAELHARFFHPLLTGTRADAIVWRGGGNAPWSRLLDMLAGTTPAGSTILAAGSHHVADGFGRALHAAGAVPSRMPVPVA